MDNKDLKGLSEVYNDVYSDNLEQLNEADPRFTRPRNAGVPWKGKDTFGRPISNPVSNFSSRGVDYRGAELQLARNAATSQIGTPRQGSAGGSSYRPNSKPSTGLSPRLSTTPAPTGRPSTPSTSRPSSSAPRPAAATPSVAAKPSNSSPANLSTPEKIKSGMQVYNAQRSAGDMKGAASTGAGVWKMANPTLAAKPTTPNPLMNKTFGYQTGNSPKEQQSRANAIASSGQVAALKPATPAATPTTPKRNQAQTRAGTLMQSYDFGKPDRITQDVASLYQSIYEGKKKIDQDEDGDNDFADVQIAKMIASGMSKEEAIRKVRNKSYNEETELDEGRSENIRDKMVARYGKPDSDDTLRLHVARKKYDKAATKHQRGYGPNPRTEIKGKLNPGQLMYKAGQSANVNKEEFEFWVNDLLDEGYDLSEYTVDEMYEIFEETELERRKAEEERKNERRARVAEMQAQGRVMTPAKRAAAQRAAKAAEKREAELEKAAQAALNSIRGATGKISEKPMGSEAPESKKAAPEATRRLRTGLKRDTLGSAADAALKAIRNEDFELWVNDLLDEGYDLSDYTWEEMDELYEDLNEGIIDRIKGIFKKPKKSRGEELRAKLGSKGGPLRARRYERTEKVYGKDAAKKVSDAGANLQGFTPRDTTTSGRLRGGGNAAMRRMDKIPQPSGANAQDLARQHQNKSGQKPMNIGHHDWIVNRGVQDITRQGHIKSRGVKKPVATSINAEFELWVNDLLDEGYDLSDYTWNELYEGYKRFPYKKVAKKINKMYDDPDTDIMFGKDAKRRHEMMRVYSHMAGNVHPMIRSESPKKSKAKEKENRRKGEMKEDFDAYDLVIEHLLDEGFADDYDSANMMIERMSDEWLEEILESKKWIQKAIKKPGSLSKQLGVPEEKNIPSKMLSAAAKKGGKLGRRARLAQTLKKFH